MLAARAAALRRAIAPCHRVSMWQAAWDEQRMATCLAKRRWSTKSDGTKESEDATLHDGAQQPEPAAQGATEEKDAVAKELASVIAERNEFKDKWLRTLAEIENLRKIKERDVAYTSGVIELSPHASHQKPRSNARDFAVQKFAKSMLEVSDSLSYALQAAQNDDATLRTLVDGVDLTKSQLVKAFNEHGVVEFCQVGDKFDPSLHQALFEIDDNDKDPSTIGQVLKSGFTLRGRILRAAQVGVVKARPTS